jgi:ATP-dependent RNA helicase RhlE|tara:strand:- start:8007 stop:9473 length:1467 start_codon:yes stop_codon:yes gene_type:complete
MSCKPPLRFIFLLIAEDIFKRDNKMTFDDLGLSPAILKAVTEKGYDTPSPIQEKAIPAVLSGRDVMAAAQTGTGKTAGFTLPLLELLTKSDRKVQSNQVRALVLTPTRELAAQVADSVSDYSKNLPIRSSVVFGGVKINPQMQRLRQGVDVLVATPGRLLDLFNQNAVRFDHLEVLILDEADRMLDMGFIHDIKKIIRVLPKQRQNLLFSATFSEDIRKLAKGLVNDPVEISVSSPNTTVETVDHWICPVDKKQKAELLCHLITHNEWKQVLVFSRTKHGANKLTKKLEAAGITATAIHGNKSQSARTKALAGFKDGQVRALVATDIAARGLDISQLPHVVNYDLPDVPEDYVHRIGRTGRAGSSGEAISLVCADEIKQLSDIERLIGELLPRKLVDGFEPDHDVPESRLRQQKPKKPKRTNAGPRQSNPRSGDRNAAGRHSSKGSESKSTGNRSSGNTASGNSSKKSSGNSTAGNSPWGNRGRSGNS